jgi:hypothetical protein
MHSAVANSNSLLASGLVRLSLKGVLAPSFKVHLVTFLAKSDRLCFSFQLNLAGLLA